jgi:hypothetical protein
MTEDITIILNTKGTAADGYTGELYAHTGVLTSTSKDNGDWKHVLASWGQNIPECKLVNKGNNVWYYTIKGGVRAWYKVNTNEVVTHLAFVFRSSDNKIEVKDNGADILIPLSSITLYTEPATIYNDTTEDVVLYVDATGTAMAGFSGDMYAHTGVLTDKSATSADWKYVKHEWTVNSPDCKMTKVEGNLWKLTITGGPRAFYGVAAGETIKQLAFVFRSADGTKELKDNGNDIFVAVQGNRAAGVMAKAGTPTEFTIAVPSGTYTNLITDEKVTVSNGYYNVSLLPHNYVVLVKTN